MATYTVVPRQRQPGYRVDVITDEGVHHSMLGFATEAEAQEWVEADRKREIFGFAPPE